MLSNRVVLITGATGAVGRVVADCLKARGYRVRLLVRSPHLPSLLSNGAEIVTGDICDDKALGEAVKGVNIIYHLAAKLHVNKPNSRDRQEYRKVNVEGTRRLVNAAAKARVSRLVFFSTINVYGCSSSGMIFDENSPLNPGSWYAETKAEAEEVVLSNLPAVVVRLAAVYGRQMKSNYPRLVKALRQGWFFVPGSGNNRRTLVHAQDVGTAVILAANHPEAVGQIYNTTDGALHTLNDIVKAICLPSGRHPPSYHLPVTPVRMLAGLIEDGLRLLGRRSPIDRTSVDKLLEDIAVSGEKIQRDLGFRPRFDIVEGWRETLGGII